MVLNIQEVSLPFTANFHTVLGGRELWLCNSLSPQCFCIHFFTPHHPLLPASHPHSTLIFPPSPPLPSPSSHCSFPLSLSLSSPSLPPFSPSTTSSQPNYQLLGPKPFPLDRLMAIFYSIIEEPVAPSADVYSQVSTHNIYVCSGFYSTPALVNQDFF